jgi:hypothetical protein
MDEITFYPSDPPDAWDRVSIAANQFFGDPADKRTVSARTGNGLSRLTGGALSRQDGTDLLHGAMGAAAVVGLAAFKVLEARKVVLPVAGVFAAILVVGWAAGR